MTFKCPDKFRIVHPHYGPGDDYNGVFDVVLRHKQRVRVIASDGLGWEHVSVSREDRCPTWDEMCQVKDLFWGDEDTVVQYHPPKSQYVNIHKNCLHLWRPTEAPMPVPMKVMVG